MNKKIWNRIEGMEDYFISYLLYREGKSIEVISIIRNESKNKIEQDIIKSRAYIQHKNKNKKTDFLVDVISLPKNERIEKLNVLAKDDKELLVDEIYKRYTQFKTIEDRMILIWLIGELDSDKLLPFLRMELKSNRFNQKRLACSALGKLNRKSTIPWLYEMIDDENPQVRQYAIKALKDMGNEETVEILNRRRQVEDKDYVIKAIEETIESIMNNI